jgi:ferredoxin
MKTLIYFYTGTGNSLWTAKKLSEQLENTELSPMTLTGKGSIHPQAENIGLIFPVHIWGMPSLVIDFVNRLKVKPAKYYFAIAVNAGQVAATLLQLKKMMQARGLNLSAGFSINLPSNYIPWGGAPAQEKQQKKFNEALVKIGLISAIIKAQEARNPDKGPLWQNILFSALYRMSFPQIPKMDKSFWADAKCTGCMICEKICPVQNILMTEGKPAWQHHCEQCFACLQWCPEESIQYGKNTKEKKRYHHPEIKLQDMLACVPKK